MAPWEPDIESGGLTAGLNEEVPEILRWKRCLSKWGNKGITLLPSKCALREGRNKEFSRRLGRETSLSQFQNLLLNTHMKNPKISSFRKKIQDASKMDNRSVIFFLTNQMDNFESI